MGTPWKKKLTSHAQSPNFAAFHQEWRRDWPDDATATGFAKCETARCQFQVRGDSGEDGERDFDKFLAALGGINEFFPALLWINARSFRISNVESVVANTRRKPSTFANSI